VHSAMHDTGNHPYRDFHLQFLWHNGKVFATSTQDHDGCDSQSVQVTARLLAKFNGCQLERASCQ
jgi:hypothetical protein